MQNLHRARAPSRDASLALGLDEQQIDFVANNIWRFKARSFPKDCLRCTISS